MELDGEPFALACVNDMLVEVPKDLPPKAVGSAGLVHECPADR